MSVGTIYTQAERLSLSLELNQPRTKSEPSIILLVTMYWNIYYFYEIYLLITKKYYKHTFENNTSNYGWNIFIPIYLLR